MRLAFRPVLRARKAATSTRCLRSFDDIELGVTYVIRGRRPRHQRPVRSSSLPPGRRAPVLATITAHSTGRRSCQTERRAVDRSLRDRASGRAVAALRAWSARPGRQAGRLARRTRRRFDLADICAARRAREAELQGSVGARAASPAFACGESSNLGVAGPPQPFWTATLGNLARLDEAARTVGVVHGAIAPIAEDRGFLPRRRCLPDDHGTEDLGA